MLKEDKDYFELATKVSTYMAEQYLKNEAQNAWERTITMALGVGSAMGFSNDRIVRDVQTAGEMMLDAQSYATVLADDEGFMNILVDDLKLGLHYIDFESFLPVALTAWKELVEEMARDML